MSGGMMMLERRPPHVPEWAWQGYKHHIATVSDPNWGPEYLVDVSTSTRIKLFTSIVASKNSAALWTALELHRDELDRLWEKPDPDRHIVNIFEAAEITCSSIHAQQRLTTAERRPYARAVATAAADLSASLRAIRSMSRPQEPTYPDEFPSFDHDEFIALLDEVQHGAQEWGAAPPRVDRPNRDGSERRFFIRQMTTHLEEIYPSARMERVAGLLADCIDFHGLGLSWSDPQLKKPVKSVRGAAARG